MDEYLRGYERGYKDAIEEMKRLLSKTEKNEEEPDHGIEIFPDGEEDK